MIPQIPDVYLSIIWKSLYSILVTVLTVLTNRLIGRFLIRRIKEGTQRDLLRMLIRNGLIILGSIIVLAIWLGYGSSFTVAMGILGAGIAFASQEVIGSMAGYVNILTGNLYRIGDRIKIGSVIGDVLDISIMRTMVMEIGEWVQADQYTGRIVSIANRAVFSDPVINYTHPWPYLWDEVMIPITYESNWQKASKMILDQGQEYTAHIQAQARQTLDETMLRYPSLQESSIQPKLYLVMTDNWIEVTLRYVVDPHERRIVKNQLHSELLQDFEREPDITVASATFEIVGFPPIKQSKTE
jgi:small-conductance mechanosensitive channel